ncbi:metal ABC transporter substrate-binding protein [uncultured Mailhella sp.]|uniref:metal ABC transporter substrate-binding protein n=1 Tax=uncultured Mailhella sp. TaxID=1981031 RepID=UPI0025F74153|nr:metal ABC transporter substrate-binding protein [uncultured Mailhella sp.]
MKIFLSLLLCLALGIVSPVLASGRELVASVFPVWLLLRQVARDVPDTSVGLLLPAGTGCPHDYSMTPQERRDLARADVLVINGLGLESFLGETAKMSQLMKDDAVVIDISSRMDNLLSEGDDGHEGHENARNPHIFASPSMMARMAESLAEQLAEKDPEHASIYRANAKRVQTPLLKLAGDYAALGSSISGHGIAVQHNVFSYLARDTGLTVDAVVQPHEGQEPSAREMLDLVRVMRDKKTAVVITEPQYPARTGKTLAAEAGIPCISLDPVAGGPVDAPADYYEQVMRENLRVLEKALGK